MRLDLVGVSAVDGAWGSCWAHSSVLKSLVATGVSLCPDGACSVNLVVCGCSLAEVLAYAASESSDALSSMRLSAKKIGSGSLARARASVRNFDWDTQLLILMVLHRNLSFSGCTALGGSFAFVSIQPVNACGCGHLHYGYASSPFYLSG
ncbi:hypothetical protein Bca4012_038247 [Brassica carinata]